MNIFCVESAYATNGVIKFRGALTQAGCAVHQPLLRGPVERVIGGMAGVTPIIDAVNKACSESAAPFTLSYRPLPGDAPAAGMDVRRGVLTLTYE